MPRQANRTVYCQQQANECAMAASGTLIAEVKDAYLNLEQGWLQLALGMEDERNCSGRLLHGQSARDPKPMWSAARRSRRG